MVNCPQYFFLQKFNTMLNILFDFIHTLTPGDQTVSCLKHFSSHAEVFNKFSLNNFTYLPLDGNTQ